MARGVMIAGTHSGSGKTTISLGIMGALSKRCRVIPFKIGPDYIDPAYHRFVSDSFSYNLDLHMLGEERLKKLYQDKAQQGDIAIVEGVMGLFDGKDSTGYASSAHVAKMLGLPVILVVDVGGMASSASAMVMGYRDFDPKLNLAGVLLNRVGGEEHFALLKECIERDTGVSVLGYLPKDRELIIPERPLGLMPPEEMKDIEQHLERLNDLVEKYIDLDGILEISKNAQTFPTDKDIQKRTMQEAKRSNTIINTSKREQEEITDKQNENIKIAIAVDEAFCFYYHASLEAFEEKGALMVPFSPIRDSKLPDGVSGLYLGGGFPEKFAMAISQNTSMRDSIFNAIDAGLPTYAEGGGLMYLMKSICSKEGKTFLMVGIFDGEAVMTDRLQNFGYVSCEVTKDNVMAPRGSLIMGHEFHYSKIKGSHDDTSYVVKKFGQNREWRCGYIYKNCLASYMHIDFYAYPELIDNFLNKCGLR
ncbi:MAG TPA: cobyrinate a,c-diamide synthase [Thermoanaerobacterales bacterium]|jgi:cobyrinic acid a,c-diamide synthase|nr:cobyrinate a,c-diamide synthase [Thermoanaerobacterales bacterium]